MIELGHVTDRKPPFRYAAYTRVGFSDTDAQGVVYYGRYLPYFDLARTEYHRHLGAIDIRGEFAMRACARRVPRARALRRPARGLRPRRADRHDERHLRPRRLPARRRRARLLMATAKQTLVLIDLDDAAARAGARIVPHASREFEELGDEHRRARGGRPDPRRRRRCRRRPARGRRRARRERRCCVRAGSSSVEDGELVLGPDRPASRDARRAATRVPVLSQRRPRRRARRGRLRRETRRSSTGRRSLICAAHCLVGWDTGGVPWDSVRLRPGEHRTTSVAVAELEGLAELAHGDRVRPGARQTRPPLLVDRGSCATKLTDANAVRQLVGREVRCTHGTDRSSTGAEERRRREHAAPRPLVLATACRARTAAAAPRRAPAAGRRGRGCSRRARARRPAAARVRSRPAPARGRTSGTPARPSPRRRSPSASGIASAVPSSASAPGTTRASFARISASGSTATTRAPRRHEQPRQLAGAGREVDHRRPAARPSRAAEPARPPPRDTPAARARTASATRRDEYASAATGCIPAQDGVTR